MDDVDGLGGAVRCVHGSLDSVDVDVVYLLPAGSTLPGTKQFAALCDAHPDEVLAGVRAAVPATTH